MPDQLADWLNLLVRWVHLIAGIAWIGSSFYFIWLDGQLTVPAPPRERVEGELWMVHSGGFYQVERRRLGPGQVPPRLHWFKWEAAITWMSGLLLLVMVYYLTSGVYLVDRGVSGVGAGTATAIGVGLLAVSWFGYDALWRSALGRRGWPASAISMALLTVVAYGLCRVMSGRAAYIHMGAMLGTLMVANVWLVILPAQSRMIAATQAGREMDLALSAQAKRRSVHNSYMTFPVLFLMLSNHYPGAYAHSLNWLVLLLLIVAGAAARHAMIAKAGTGRWALAPAAAAIVAVVAMTGPPRAASQEGESARFAAVREIVNRRCLPCHSAFPTDDVFRTAQGGVMFDTPDDIRRRADRIRERAVVTETMPLGNKTAITPGERALLGRWVAQGARLR